MNFDRQRVSRMVGLRAPLLAATVACSASTEVGDVGGPGYAHY